MTYSTYLFDLDGTLYSRDQLVRRLIEEQYQEFRGFLQQVRESHYVERVIQLDAHGYYPKDQLYAQIAKEWNLNSTVQGQLQDHFWSRYNAHHEVPDDTLATLSSLKASGRRLGVITNGRSDRQNQKIDAMGIRDYFDTLVISEEEGLKKPHPDIFNRAVKRCHSVLSNTVFIGDHPIADIDGAREAGLAAVWKKVPYWAMTRPDVRIIERLGELLD